LRLAGRLKESGGVVVNGDDPAWSSIDAGRHTLVVFSSAAAGDLRASDVELDASGSTFTLEWKGESRRVRFPLPAGYNVENALAAAGAGLLFGLTLDEVAHGLENAPRVKGRLEVVHEDSFTVLIDFAHTPDALRGALAAVRPLTRGRLIVVFGAGGDRDRTKRGPMAVAVAELADVVILTSDNPRTEDPERILDDLAVGLSGVAFHRFVDRRDAIRHALEMAATGDTVVLAGKGHETYQVIGHEKRPFDERTVVRDCLARLGAA
ncbi:MAG: Mur ligase family protein, partial [Gemmatimonadota bacterium]|nr:Mur ligase family protein [Gemmatimonadota bacterium]